MRKKVLKTIKKHGLIGPHSDIVLGLSGGPDSLALLYVLTEEAKALDWVIHPVHINHRFRPGAAEEDQAFVEDVCFKLYEKTEGRVRPCSTFVVDCQRIAELNHWTSEEAGRAVRYESFLNVASKLKSEGRHTVIAVAQNANDQAETILFRVIRGTSIDGLSGIAYKRYAEWCPDDESYKGGIPEGAQTDKDEDGAILVVRPLLDCTRAEIEDYCKGKGLEPRRDLTNDEPVYTRNRLRLEILPKLSEINPNIISVLNRLGETAAVDSDYLQTEATGCYKDCLIEIRHLKQEIGKEETEAEDIGFAEKTEVVLDNSKLKELHQAIRYRVYRTAIARVGMKENMARTYLESIDKISTSLNGKAYTELNGGYRVRRETQKLVFYHV